MKNNSQVQYKIDIGKRADGSRIRKSFYGKSKKAAKEKAEQWLLEQAMKEQTETSVSAPLLKDVAEDYKSYKSKFVRNNTTVQYNSVFGKFLDVFGDVPVNEITKQDIEAYADDLSEKYSQVYIKNILTHFSAVLAYAVEKNYITVNPCRKIKYKSQKEEKSKTVYTEEQTGLILEYSRIRPDGISIDIMLSCGTTISETLGIQYSDIDFENNTIAINRSVTISSGTVNVDQPKNKHRKRIIAAPVLTIENIKKNMDQKYKYVVHAQDPNGPYNPQDWRRHVYKEFMTAMHYHYQEYGIDIPVLNPHELRHTRATIWVNKDINLFAIAEQMGWSDLEMLRKVYGHPDINKLRKALEM